MTLPDAPRAASERPVGADSSPEAVVERSRRAGQQGLRPRVTAVWLGVVGSLAALAVAASTDPIDLWVQPRTADDRPRQPAVVDDAPVELVPGAPDAASSVLGTIVLIVLAFAIMALLTTAIARSELVVRLDRRFRWRRLTVADEQPLQPATMLDADDIEAARHALRGGDARNGIVECWMRLEHGAGEIGLPRLTGETAEEYSHRLVATAPVDPAPLDELANLYLEARFSDHPLSETKRSTAASALDRIVGTLR